MKGRGLVLQEPTRTWVAFSLPTAGRRDRAGGPQRGPADIRSPRGLPADRCCCGASPLGSQGTCSGLAAGSGVREPRLGAVVPLMVSAGQTDTHGDTHTQTYVHSQRQVPCADMDPPFRAQTGTEAQSGDQAPGATVSQSGNPRCPSEETPAPPHSPTKRFNRKQTSTTQLRSRAAPGAVQAARGRESVAHDHSMAELVPIPQQGLYLGGAHPQHLLQQLLPGCVLPVPVCHVGC